MKTIKNINGKEAALIHANGSATGGKVYLNTDQFAKRWLVCTETMRRYLRAGVLPSIIIKRHRLILLDDIIRYEEGATVGGSTSHINGTTKA